MNYRFRNNGIGRTERSTRLFVDLHAMSLGYGIYGNLLESRQVSLQYFQSEERQVLSFF
jgi:hypothetical protein